MSAEYLKPSPESPAATTTRPSATVSSTNRPSGESVHEHTCASSTVGSRSTKLRATRARRSPPRRRRPARGRGRPRASRAATGRCRACSRARASASRTCPARRRGPVVQAGHRVGGRRPADVRDLLEHRAGSRARCPPAGAAPRLRGRGRAPRRRRGARVRPRRAARRRRTDVSISRITAPTTISPRFIASRATCASSASRASTGPASSCHTPTRPSGRSPGNTRATSSGSTTVHATPSAASESTTFCHVASSRQSRPRRSVGVHAGVAGQPLPRLHRPLREPHPETGRGGSAATAGWGRTTSPSCEATPCRSTRVTSWPRTRELGCGGQPPRAGADHHAPHDATVPARMVPMQDLPSPGLPRPDASVRRARPRRRPGLAAVTLASWREQYAAVAAPPRPRRPTSRRSASGGPDALTSSSDAGVHVRAPGDVVVGCGGRRPRPDPDLDDATAEVVDLVVRPGRPPGHGSRLLAAAVDRRARRERSRVVVWCGRDRRRTTGVPRVRPAWARRRDAHARRRGRRAGGRCASPRRSTRTDAAGREPAAPDRPATAATATP